MNIVECTSSVYDIQLNETFKTALREIDSFKVFRIHLVDESGRSSEGECVATPAIVGDSFDEFQKIFENEVRPNIMRSDFEGVRNSSIWPSIKSAIDCALLALTETYMPVSLSTDVTLPVCEIESLEETLNRRLDAGFSSIKLKLDQRELAVNVEKTLLTNNLLKGRGLLRIDPNQAWTSKYSIDFLKQIKDLGVELEYIEQPVNSGDLDGLKRVKEAGIYEVMADESCFTEEDARKLIDMSACDWINIKLLKAGGLTPARRIAQMCANAGIKVSVGSMLESPLGVIASMRLANEIAPRVVHDLDAAWWYQTSLLKYHNGLVSTL